MKQRIKLTISSVIAMLVASALFLSLSAHADEKADIEKVRAELTKMISQAAAAEIVASPVKGVYRMELQGNFAYAYVDGDYVLLGDLYDTKSQVNLGDQASAERMATLIGDVPTSKMIVYGPQDAKRHITVFTDIDCSYCQKLHREVPQLNDAGVQVRYLAFPRAGIGSTSHKKYVSVWCNDDQQSSLTAAKSGQSVPTATCDNPVGESYNLGRQVGVRGTPTIILDDGTVTPGYVQYTELIKRMGISTEADKG